MSRADIARLAGKKIKQRATPARSASHAFKAAAIKGKIDRMNVIHFQRGPKVPDPVRKLRSVRTAARKPVVHTLRSVRAQKPRG